MKQTVLIGLGGTGSRVVNNVAKELNKRNIEINDGIVTCAVLDTNQSDNDLITASGTQIPVIPTCDERFIDQYLALYANKNPFKWCPYSRSFGQESMIDGASEIRSKSRIAFMDTMATSKIFELQNAIEKVFHNKPGTPEKIRVMLVSSLAGGTGSGMFIQVALWLRKFFEERNCLATIRGIFLLPDIFIRTLPNVRDNARKKLYHYANAYAAIRELNSINKVIKGNVTLEKPIIIDDLFDSRHPSAKPVFDNAFFIDDVDAGGAAFESIEQYEEIVAQIVYMQLYAPMHSELSSVEDNLFRAFESNPEPVYGSCGTAKAEYPVETVAQYCALRASQESVAEGWNKLDAEIDAMIQEEKDAENDGLSVEKRVSRRDMFVRLFDERSGKTGVEVGKGDRLFVSIKSDVFNEKRERIGNTDEYQVIRTGKVKRFMELLEEEIMRSVTENGGYEKIAKIGKDLPDPENPENFSDNLVQSLKDIRNREKEAVEKVIKNFDEKCKEYADAIIRAVVPLDIGSVSGQDEKSLYGLFMKKDPNGKDFYVHPVAVRYLLYKLAQEIEQRQNTLDPESKKKKAKKGDETVSFNIPKTKKKETLEGYWDQLGLITSKAEIQHFIRKYIVFNASNKTLCMQYETELLTQMVLRELSSKVSMLIEELEKLFKDFPRLIEKLQEEIDTNISLNEQNLNKTLFVFAKGEHKEAKYRSLGMNLNGRVDELNEEVIKAAYGKFCVRNRPNVEANQEYADRSVVLYFHDKIIETFTELVTGEYEDEVCLSIIQAIKAESDYEYGKKEADKKEKDPFARQNAAKQAAGRYDEAIKGYRDRLARMARPFLIAQPDESLAVISNMDGITIDANKAIWMQTGNGQILHMPFQTQLTFWGFHPVTGSDYPAIGAALGANKTTAANTGYGINELYCYSSIYGVVAEAINKFNEQSGGAYYTNYSAVINHMLTKGGEVDTPHIDKTWHEFLPYVSSSRDKVARQQFYKAFWRGIAYGRISLDPHGKFRISKQTVDSYNNINYEHELLLEDGRTIGKTDIARLIKALKLYPGFETMVSAQLEEAFQHDVADMTTYISTEIVRGLVVDGELNPVTILVRYAASQGYSVNVKGDLVGALGEIMKDVASKFDMNRSAEQINEAKIKLCHRIYEKCPMAGKNALLEGWIRDFRKLKLAVANDGDNGAAGASAAGDII